MGGRIKTILLVSPQGKTPLAKWYLNASLKEKTRMIRNITSLYNFIEFKDKMIVYKRCHSYSYTHFKVMVVVEQFGGKPLLQRHRLVNAVLQQELSDGISRRIREAFFIG
ncbi:hypothetical protein PR001_g22127 [Phytophthora rubi]|uniref:Uncharacterized protein n=1 Tax=Phytophthora rubi TaxID=129364 RepID=A0A6A3J156_9STRA|nr:hypothetical protein PR001_g22127 [Phytophthora rubi]